MNTRRLPSLDEVFSPQGIAVVGVSGSGKLGFAEMILMAHMEIKTPKLYPVNPKYKEIFGIPCFPSVLEIPDSVDHVIVNIPADLVLELLEQCAEKKVKSVHFFTAGFGESGQKDRAELEKQMLDIAQKGKFRIIGPNCVGLYIPEAKTANILGVPYEHGSIGFLSQSGGHASNLPAFGASRGLRFSKVVSYGNALDIDEIELLEYMADDEKTDTIGIYIEGLKNGQAFFKALKSAAAKKPVIVYKGGKTEAGQRAAKGHTASMISSVNVFNAVCRQVNAIEVDNIDQMIDVMVALRFLPLLPKAKNLVLFGSGGGPSVLAGDEMEAVGLTIPQFNEKTQSKLKSLLPVDGGIFINPLDTVNLVEPEAIEAALNVFIDLPDVDMIVYHFGFHPIGMWGLGRFSKAAYLEKLIRVMNQARNKTDKALMLALRPPLDVTSLEEFLEVQMAFVKNKFPVFHSLGDLALAVNRVVDWKNNHDDSRG